MRNSPEVDEICARLYRGEITRDAFIEECVRLACRQVGCSRVGLWIFIDSERGRVLRCLGMYDGIGDRMCSVADETESDARPYFAELESAGHVLANDARNHPATRDFFQNHLNANGVRSLMAAAFALNGKLFGAFTCTQVGEPMAWAPRQLVTLTKIGTRATLALAAASPRQLDSFFSPL